MHPESEVFHFGAFELDTARRRLMRGRERIPLPGSHVDILLLLASRAGDIISNDALADAGWKETAVTDNSVSQALSRLRKTLGTQKDGSPFIENIVGRGYRFVAPVARPLRRQPQVELAALLAPYRAFVEGRAAIETLHRDALAGARQAFEDALRAAPDHPAVHIGLANACVLDFEATRADVTPDLAALQRANDHAHKACELDVSSGDAWSTLAFVLHRHGDTVQAIAAARRAVTLEPHEWRHYARLAFVSWGGQRLLAVQRVATMYRGLALAHWLAATVYIARQDFDEAIDELRAGCAAHDAQRQQTDRFHAVGLHLLHGLVLAARGQDDDALAELSREIADADARHVYAREVVANSWYATGALRLRHGCRDEAAAAFEATLQHLPGHALAGIGLAAIAGVPPAITPRPHASGVDTAIATGAALALAGKHHDAARLCGAALAQADPGAAGWMLPVEPLLGAIAHPDAWAHTLAILRHRAA